MRYNIALVPPDDKKNMYEHLSVKYFQSIHNGYLLGINSIPHITLCQFECSTTDENITNIIQQCQRDFYGLFLDISIMGFSIIKLKNEFSGLHSAELSVARNKAILQLHQRIVAFIQTYHKQPINDFGDYYRPHLTLSCFDPIRGSEISVPLTLPEEIFDHQNFSVVIGIADKMWQFNEIIPQEL